MTQDIWDYAVYYAEDVAGLEGVIKSDARLDRKQAPHLTAGWMAAVAYPASQAAEARLALMQAFDDSEDDVEHPYHICGPSEVDVKTSLMWMFPGQGAQRVGLLKQLYDRSSFFKRHLDLYLGEASSEVGLDFIGALYPLDGSTPENEERLTETSFCQPVMVGLTLALAAWFHEAGLRVSGALGHSLGEFGAATFLGGLEPQPLMRFVAKRGRAMVDSLEGEDPGAMAAIMAPAKAVETVLKDFPEVIVANINQPRQTVISGPTTSVEDAVKALRRARLPGKKIPVSHAFHSPLMHSAAMSLVRDIEQLTFKSLDKPLYSAIMGNSISEAKMLEEMFKNHAESPVDFIGALRLANDGGDSCLFLEMGPGKTLSNFARYTLGSEEIALESASGAEDGNAQLSKTLVELVKRGIPVGSGMLSV